MTKRPSLSRRRAIRFGILGLGGLAALPLLAACGGSSAPAAPTSAPASTSSSSGAASTPAAGSGAAPTTAAASSAAPTTSAASSAAPSAAAASGAATGPKTQVVFSNSTSAGDPTRVEAWDTLIGQFEKANPNITVGKQYIPDSDYYDKMVAQAATGTMPDVVSSRSDMHITWSANQMLLPLDDLVKGADFNIKDFSPETLKGGQLKDKLYGVARSISAYIMFYNKELYDKNGVPVPDDKMTWSAFLDPAKKLTKDTGSGKVDQWGHIITSDWKMWISLMWENGGDYENADQTMSTINTKEATDLVQYYLDL